MWSRGEDLITMAFPDLLLSLSHLPSGIVLDGEVLILDQMMRPRPFADLQKRLGRVKPSAKLMLEHPAYFYVYDCLEFEGRDLRSLSYDQRRQQLQAFLDTSSGKDSRLVLSSNLAFSNWEELANLRQLARDHRAEGVMLKLGEGSYKVGRTRGEWWKWKIDPLTLDAVLLYAQAGHGRRATLYTDYTFGIWDNGQLVPIAKAYSGLSDQRLIK